MEEEDTIELELTLVDDDNEPSFDPRNSGVSPILNEQAMSERDANWALKNTK